MHGTIRHEPAQASKRVAWDLDDTALPAVLWEGVRSHAILAILRRDCRANDAQGVSRPGHLDGELGSIHRHRVSVLRVDAVLKSVCAIARSAPREGDVRLRYGGEEFLAVLPAASADDLRRVGERLRRAVEGSVLADEKKAIRVTVSVDGKSYPSQMVETKDMVVQFADEALYRAKESGRNRVEITR